MEITLSNYRAFSAHAPVTLEVADGITFLLGVNNVGKSALLRAFFELRPFVSLDELNRAKHGSGARNFDTSPPFDRLAHRATVSKPIKVLLKQGDNGWQIVIKARNPDLHTQQYAVETSFIGPNAPSPDEAQFAANIFHNSMYVGSFRSPAVQVNDALFDIQIGRKFVEQWDSWANGERVDHSRQVELLVQELQTLFGFNRLSISVSRNKEQLYLTTEDGRFSLSELGDGIAHFVVVLGNAMIRRPEYIFIDEPEIGLHPRMQETFVRSLAAKAKRGLIATSHSVGLARSVADRIITVTREKDGHRKCSPFGEHRTETLVQSISELGYSQYAELGGNHLLLVEGRTDIKAYREILRKFHLEQHFLLWSLNGSDWLKAPRDKIVDELNDLKRLNARSISVIFDSERTSSLMTFNPQLQGFYELCQELGFNVFPTDRHSTENYVTQAALDAVIPGHRALGEFEPFGSNGSKWEKAKNWLLFREMRAEDFERTGLKEFIVGPLAKQVGT